MAKVKAQKDLRVSAAGKVGSGASRSLTLTRARGDDAVFFRVGVLENGDAGRNYDAPIAREDVASIICWLADYLGQTEAGTR